MNEEASPSKNGNSTTALAKLLNQLNLPTLALVLLTGGGNWFKTQNTGDEQRIEIHRAIQQVHELHDALQETEKRQRTALNNQLQILEHDAVLLREVHDIASKLERLKRLDQMRGAPE
jgi:hypothetical protein